MLIILQGVGGHLELGASIDCTSASPTMLGVAIILFPETLAVQFSNHNTALHGEDLGEMMAVISCAGEGCCQGEILVMVGNYESQGRGTILENLPSFPC